MKIRKNETVSIPSAKKCCYSSQLILKYIQYFTVLSVVFEKQVSAAFGSVQQRKLVQSGLQSMLSQTRENQQF